MSPTESTLPTVLVVPRSKVSKLLLSTSTGSAFTCVISIGDPGQRRPSGLERVVLKLRLEFHDVAENTPHEIAPSEADVERLVRFAKHAFSTRGTVLIHCEAGISRSTAAALILYAVWLGPGAEREAASRVFQAVAGASPNAAMVRWADQILQREGALIAALVR